jgi:uncharacterized repeat protein (TIGR01451 family)
MSYRTTFRLLFTLFVCLVASAAFAQLDYTFANTCSGHACVNVSNVQNNLSTLKLTFTGFSAPDMRTVYILLMGPAGRLLLTANASNVAFNGGVGPGTFALTDGATALPSTGAIGAGTYAPRVYSTPTVPSSIPFLPEYYEADPKFVAQFESVGPWGTGAVSTTYLGQNPNGVWYLKVLNASFTSAVLTIGTNLDLAITKSHSGTWKQGDTNKNYTIHVANVSTTALSPAKLVTVTDTIPAGLTVNAITGTGWTCSAANAVPLTCSRTSTLAALTSFPDISINVNVASNATTVTNTATLTVAGGDSDASDDSSDDPTTILQIADLGITIDDGVATVTPGSSSLTYTVVATNNGPSAVTGANINAFFSYLNNVTFTASATGGATGFQASGSGGVSNSVNMPSGSTITYVITGNLSSQAPAGTLSNSASISAPFDGFDANSANNSATDIDTCTPQANLAITKTAATTVASDTDLTWTVTLTNAGPSDAHTVSITDTLPVAFVSQVQTNGFSSFFNTSNNGNAITDTIFSLAAGASVQFEFVGHVPPATAAGTRIENTVTVTSADDPVTSDNTSTAVTHVPGPDLTITKTHSGTFTQGDTADPYTITVTNSGQLPTSGLVTVTEAPPVWLTVVGMSGSGWDCSALPSCTRSNALAAGQSYPPITATVSVAAATPPAIDNAADVSGGGQADTTNDHVVDTTAIVPLPNVTVAQNLSGPILSGSTNVSFTFTVSNTGGLTTSTPPVFTEVLSGGTGITITSLTGPGWTCTPATLTCVPATVLDGGQSYPPITMTFNVSATASNYWTSTATVSGGGEVYTSDNTATANFTVYGGTFGAPSPLIANDVSDGEIDVTWTPVVGADHYILYRAMSINGMWTPVADQSGTFYPDTDVLRGVGYLYRAVAAAGPSTTSDYTPIDAAVAMTFADSTAIKLQHIFELRIAADGLRHALGLGDGTYDGTTAVGTVVKAANIVALQNAIRQARNVISLPDLYTGAAVPVSGGKIRKSDVELLRAGCR